MLRSVPGVGECVPGEMRTTLPAPPRPRGNSQAPRLRIGGPGIPEWSPATAPSGSGLHIDLSILMKGFWLGSMAAGVALTAPLSSGFKIVLSWKIWDASSPGSPEGSWLALPGDDPPAPSVDALRLPTVQAVVPYDPLSSARGSAGVDPPKIGAGAALISTHPAEGECSPCSGTAQEFPGTIPFRWASRSLTPTPGPLGHGWPGVLALNQQF